jgi:hypothetical protein
LKFIFTKLRAVFSSKIFYRIIGLLILGLILTQVNLKKVYQTIVGASVNLVLIGFLLTIPTIFLRSFRWNLMMRALRLRVPFRETFFYQIIAQLSFFTPGKLGDFVKALYIKGKGFSLGKATVSVIEDRIFDLICVAGVASVAFVYFSRYNQLMILLPPVAIIFAFVLLTKYQQKILAWGERFIQFLTPGTLKVSIEKLFELLGEVISSATVFRVSNYVLLSIGAFLVQAFRIWCFSLALDMEVGYLPLTGVVALMSIANLLPISFLGLGTRDAVFVYFFGQLNVSPELAIALSVIILGNILVASGLGGLVMVIHPPSVDLDQLSEDLTNETA